MKIDHLVYAAPGLAEGIAKIRDRLGVEPTPGGRHPEWGTANALVSLGDGAYLEIIGPDVDGGPPDGPRPFGVDALDAPRLVTWAIRVTDIEKHAVAARLAGHDPGPILEMGRTRPDGERLTWRLTMRDDRSMACDGLVPFLIDWGVTAHPTAALPSACTLIDLRAAHPDPGRVRAALDALGATLEVSRNAAPSLAATIRTLRGRVSL